MKSYADELAALLRLYDYADIHKAPDADADIARLAPGVELPPEVPVARQAMPVVCLLFRGELKYPDNVTGQCDDCAEPIQLRPTVLTELEKLCGFCALRRIAN